MKIRVSLYSTRALVTIELMRRSEKAQTEMVTAVAFAEEAVESLSAVG
jgi:hypothetical protein